MESIAKKEKQKNIKKIFHCSLLKSKQKENKYKLHIKPFTSIIITPLLLQTEQHINTTFHNYHEKKTPFTSTHLNIPLKYSPTRMANRVEMYFFGIHFESK